MDAVDGYGAPWPWGHCKPLRVHCLGVVHAWGRGLLRGPRAREPRFRASYHVGDDRPQVSEALRHLPQRCVSECVQGRAHLCFMGQPQDDAARHSHRCRMGGLSPSTLLVGSRARAISVYGPAE
jgi:hypothetical protein